MRPRLLCGGDMLKRWAFLFSAVIILLANLSGCNKNEDLNFFGTYTFEKVSYLSLLSSSTVDFEQKKMMDSVYTITAKMFKMESAAGTVEIDSPKYIREEIPKEVDSLCDVRSFIGNDVKYQYTIYSKDGNKTHWRLYVSSDCLWISSYADNTANGAEIIMKIYKLSNKIL